MSFWDFENDLLTSQLVVDSLERFQFVVDLLNVLRVQQDLLDLVTTNQVSDSLTNDFSWENQVFQDLVVNSRQGSGSWSLLSLSRLSGWLWQDSSFSQEDDVTVWELLFQFTGQLGLNLVVTSQRWDWDKDSQGLLTSSNVDLLLLHQSLVVLYKFVITLFHSDILAEHEIHSIQTQLISFSYANTILTMPKCITNL